MPPQNKHTIKCRQCGKTFMRIPSRNRIFCSLECHGLSRRIKIEIRFHLTPDSVRQIRKNYDEGNSANELATEYGVSRCTIMNIIRRRTWNHLDQSPPLLV